MRNGSALIPLLIILCGCAGDETGAAGDIAAAASFTVEPVGRIGSLDDPDRILTRVGTVLIGPDGGLFVAQPADNTIRVFGADGAPRGSMGRRGGGPGEFRNLGPIVFAGDTLVANGWGSLSRFLPNGDFVETRPWAPARLRVGNVFFDASFPAAFALGADGGGYVVPMSLSERMASDEKPGVLVDSVRTPIYRLGPNGEIADTVCWQENRWASIIVARAGRTFDMPSPFRYSPLVALLAGGRGVVMVDRSVPSAPEGPAEFRVTVLRDRGDTAAARSIAYTPFPMRDSDVSWRLGQQAIYPRDDAPPVAEFAAMLRREDRIPAVRTPVTALVAGQDGTIWLRREDAAGDPVSWLILDAMAETIGELKLPGAQTVVAAADDRLVTLEHDSLDVPYLMLYRIHRH